MPALSNLPLQLTSFVGREREIMAVIRLLGTSRLLTLTGTGGSGKTRLAVEAASQLLDRFCDGVFFVNLAPIKNPGLVVSTIAQTLGVSEAPGQPLIETLKAYVQSKELLLLLDNFEQVLAAASVVMELLLAAPDLKVIVTSREPLRFAGEQQFHVPPLDLPPPEEGVLVPASVAARPVEYLIGYEAVTLFIERAKAVRCDFDLTEENVQAAANICRRLDGLPLAVELAAARVRHLSLPTMLKRLGQRLSLLTGGAVDLPARHRTLRAAIEWSYDLLSDAEQQLLRRMAVFQGGRTLPALEAVCNFDGALQIDMLEGVSALVEKSLLQPREGRGAEVRYWLLETIHEYAREKLEESGEADDLRREHALYFTQLAEAVEPHLVGDKQVEWLDRMEDEHDNVRSALAWCRANDPEMGCRLLAATWRFRYIRGHWTESFDSFQRMLSLRKGSEGVPSTLYHARALFAGAFVGYYCGQVPTARIWLEQSVMISQRLRARVEWAQAVSCLEVVKSAMGEPVDWAAFQEALQVLREAQSDWQLAFAISALGEAARTVGNYDDAAGYYLEALDVWRRVNDLHGIAAMFLNLGYVEYYRCNLAHSISYFRQSIKSLMSVGAAHGVPTCMAGLASTLSADGQSEIAARLFGAVDSLGAGYALPVLPTYAEAWLKGMDHARSQLGDPRWQSAWAEGQAMSIEQAVAYALQDKPATEAVSRVTVISVPRHNNSDELTCREVEVLRLLARGLSNAQIAERLFLSANTVRAHLYSIYSKLGVSNRVAAIRLTQGQ